MELAKIKKYIKLANENITELLRVLEFDRQQAIMEEKGKTMKLANAVKKVIDLNEYKKSRPILSTIMHDKDGKQFICDGFMLIKWNEYQEELDGFMQTDYDRSIKIENILPKEYNTTKHELNKDEILILKNIDKYIKLYKDKIKSNEFLPIKLFGKIYPASFIKKAFDIIGEIKNYNLLNNNEHQSAFIYENGVEVVLLPIKTNDEEKQRVEKLIQDFLARLKGE